MLNSVASMLRCTRKLLGMFSRWNYLVVESNVRFYCEFSVARTMKTIYWICSCWYCVDDLCLGKEANETDHLAGEISEIRANGWNGDKENKLSSIYRVDHKNELFFELLFSYLVRWPSC